MVAPGKTVSSLANGVRSVSKRLVISYVFDWVLILCTFAVGGAFSLIDGTRHAFSLSDPDISYPIHSDTVSVGVLLVVAIVAPGIITAIISLVLVPGQTLDKSTPKALIWRRKLWEWNTAWMGLGVALAGAFMITEGLKDISGKPRPHLLAVCNPNTSTKAIQKYRIGGLGDSLDSSFPIIVDWRICQTTDYKALRNAFASFPSGHSSFSWAGMLYLTFFLSAKFAIQLPFLRSNSPSRRYISTFDEEDQPLSKTDDGGASSSSVPAERPVPPRNESAAPPVYLLIIAFIPIAVAFFISISRWFDYRHHGFDIICGSLIGIFTAWFGFRWYHLPIRQGAGWAWGARSRSRAFWVGVGVQSYVGEEGWESTRNTRPRRDSEGGIFSTENGIADDSQIEATGGVSKSISTTMGEEHEAV